jgi:hypothetical protein
MVVVVGLLQVVVGLTALLNEGFLNAVGAGNLVVWDLAAWGWIYLAFGLATLMVGTALFSGAAWARSTAVMLSALSLVAQFVFVSVYPLWSVVLMVLSLVVVYALTARAGE